MIKTGEYKSERFAGSMFAKRVLFNMLADKKQRLRQNRVKAIYAQKSKKVGLIGNRGAGTSTIMRNFKFALKNNSHQKN